jgi:hypothetical protein
MFRLAVSLGLLSASVFAGVTYTVNDITAAIDPTGAAGAVPTALSNTGLVAGTEFGACSVGHCGFVYNNGTVTVLGSTPSQYVQYVAGVNDSGQAAVSTGNAVAARFLNGSTVSLFADPLLSGGSTSAVGIDNSGDVLALAQNAQSSADDYLLWKADGSYVDLGTYNFFVRGGAISSTGYATGSTPAGTTAFLYHNGTTSSITNLAGATSITPTGVSSNGLVVGYSKGSATTEVFLSTGPGNIQDLGPASDLAYDVNSSGTIVGIGTSSGPAFVYSSGVWSDLNALLRSPLGFTISGVVGIDDAGTILATGTDANSQYHILLLTPSAATPEPATAALLTAGLAAILLRNKLRTKGNA